MRSKLSLHIMNWDPVEKTNNFIERTQPPVLKVMDGGLNDSKLEEAKRNLAPGTLVIGRIYFQNQQAPTDENIETYNPLAAAQATFGAMQEQVGKMGWLVDVWEGLNEIAIDENGPVQPKHRRRAQLLSEFNVHMANLMHGAGKKYAAYSFSTGNPNHIELWDELLPGLMASDYLALHEYIFPTQDYQVPDIGMCNRYRKIIERLPAAARRPILITECGADLHGMTGAEGGGYRNKLSEPKYWQWLAAYDAELMKDPYVLGATIYTHGASDGWETYDISDSFTRLMMNEIMNLPDQPARPVEFPPAVVTMPAKPQAPIKTQVPTKPQPPATPVTAQPELLKLAQVRALVQEAIDKLDASDGNGARDILVREVNPWFYRSAPQHSTDLANAQAHTTARWFSEEATRRIEAQKLGEARDLLRDNVLTWLDSPGPSAIGILAVEAPKKKATKKKAAAKKASAKKPSAKKASKRKTVSKKKTTTKAGKK